MASGGLSNCLSLMVCFTEQSESHSNTSNLCERHVVQILARIQAIMIDDLVVFLNPSSQMWGSSSNWATAVSYCILSNSLPLGAMQSKRH